jgi:hypothetical protein
MESEPQLLAQLCRVLVSRQAATLSHVAHGPPGRFIRDGQVERQALPQDHLLVEDPDGVGGAKAQLVQDAFGFGSICTRTVSVLAMIHLRHRL